MLQPITNTGISVMICLLLVHAAPLGDLHIYFNSTTVNSGFLYGADFQSFITKTREIFDTWIEQKLFYGIISGITLFYILGQHQDLPAKIAVATVFFAAVQFGNLGALIISLLYLIRGKPLLFFAAASVASFIKPFYFIILTLYCLDKRNRQELLVHFLVIMAAFLYYWISRVGVMSSISGRSDFGFNHIGILQYLADDYMNVMIVVIVGSLGSMIIFYGKLRDIFALFFMTTPRLKEYDVFVGIFELFRADKRIRGWACVLLFGICCLSSYISPKLNIVLGFIVLLFLIEQEAKNNG